ncbi:MAG: phosphatidylserine decarboxylase family protein [Micromonosporaceae bacterium]|nr:phosphatidylserine decarboxylase family protein [Micromonosporaceae bacterium]
MTEPAADLPRPTHPLGQVRVGAPAARTLVIELTRRAGPKTALLVGAGPHSPVLAAAVDALLPEDSLLLLGPGLDGTGSGTEAAAAAGSEALRAHLAGLGGWVQERVRVVDSLAAVDPVDVVIVAEPVIGTAERARAGLDELSKAVTAGGVVVVAAVAVPGVAPGATAELDRQAMLYGVGSDLVLRNLPPLRVHRLRWLPADPALADQLTPVSRPSSVPLTRSWHVDSHGVAAGGIALGLAALAKLARPGSRLWLLPAAAALPVAAFFRDPQRDQPADGSLVLAASDGRVLSVERISDDRFSGDGSAVDYLRVAVFLSVLDVHINRSPVAGEVVDHFLEDGGYAAAMSPTAEHNVAAYTVVQTARGRVAVAQRTGLLARRIVHRAPVGSLLARGERFGLIRFGSRTDVYLPADRVEVLVAAGDRVTGGGTPLARWR